MEGRMMYAKDWRLSWAAWSILLVGTPLSAQDAPEGDPLRWPDHAMAATNSTAANNDSVDVNDGRDGVDVDDELDQLLDQDIASQRRTSVNLALDVEVSTVSRQQGTVGRSPAAVYVIDEEMIRRSGATRARSTAPYFATNNPIGIPLHASFVPSRLPATTHDPSIQHARRPRRRAFDSDG